MTELEVENGDADMTVAESRRDARAPLHASPRLRGLPRVGPRFGPAPGLDSGRLTVLGGMLVLVAVGVGLVLQQERVRDDGRPTHAPPPPSPVANAATLTVARVQEEPASVPSVRVAEPPKPPTWRVAMLGSDPAIEVVEASFGKRSLVAALTEAGVPRDDVRKLAKACDGLRSGGSASKDSFALAKRRTTGQLVAFELILSPRDVWQAKVDEASDGRVVVKKLELLVEERHFPGAFVITTDVAAAIAAAGLREGLAEKIDEAIQSHVDPTSVKPGLQLRVVTTEEWVEGAFVDSRIDAVEVRPPQGAPLRVYYYARDTSVSGSRRSVPLAGFYDGKAQMPYKGAFRSPVPLARITSRFDPKRKHPVLKQIMPHNGVDFGAGTGTPVYASAAGTLTHVGPSGPCGNMIEIGHAGGITTAYCHLSRFASGLHVGQQVEARQLVGYVGQTGRVTGPHLHFAVKRKGMFIDPLALKLDGVRVLAPVDREVFAKKRAELDAALDAVPLPVAVPDAIAKDDTEDKDMHGD